MSAPPVKRKLAAILAADAVGYSRLMAQNEEGTMRVLSAHRAVIDGIIEFHNGRIVGTAGDSVLAEFASPVEAMRCAVEIQAALKTRNDSLPEASRLQFRIGLNLGDVMVKGDDLLGDGVNVAARLEGIAEPGGICISSSVYDQIAGKLDLGFVAMGERNLKNIERPIRVYRVSAGASSAPAGVPAPRRRWAAYGIGALVALGAAWMWARPAAPPATSLASAPASQPKAVPAVQAAPVGKPSDAQAQSARAAEKLRESELKAEGARIAAHAQEEIAKARAEAEIARARADAATMRRDAAAELAAARTARAAPPAAVDAPTAPAPQIASAAPGAKIASAAPAPARAAKPGAQWIATRRCTGFRRFPAFEDKVPVWFEHGEFVVEKGVAGRQGHLVLRGAPAMDGSLVLAGSLIARHGRIRGSEVSARLEGTLEAGRYVMKGLLGSRPCEIELAKRAP